MLTPQLDHEHFEGDVHRKCQRHRRGQEQHSQHSQGRPLDVGADLEDVLLFNEGVHALCKVEVIEISNGSVHHELRETSDEDGLDLSFESGILELGENSEKTGVDHHRVHQKTEGFEVVGGVGGNEEDLGGVAEGIPIPEIVGDSDEEEENRED